MSSSMHNDLQDVEITEPPPECITLLDNTASVVSTYGLEIEKKIRDYTVNNERFNFLRSSDLYHAFYQKKLTEYRSLQNQDGAQPDATVRVADRKGPPFMDQPPLESHIPCKPPQGFTRKELSIVKPPQGFTRNELSIVRLTALFVGRYGVHFHEDLMKRVAMNPQFEFLKESDGRFCYFSQLVVAYSSEFRPSEKLSKSGDCRKAALEDFLEHVRLEKQEGVEMAVSDLHATS